MKTKSKARDFYDGQGVALADAGAEGDAPVWIQIAKSGSFLGHPSGPFELDEQTFREIIRNHDATENRQIPVDYEHATEMDPGAVATTGAPAIGWITELRIENGNLWGLCSWLPQARDQIRAGAYKYLSPAVRFGAKDRVTGKPIGAKCTSCALTNTPFLDGMMPLAAKDSPDDLAVQLRDAQGEASRATMLLRERDTTIAEQAAELVALRAERAVRLEKDLADLVEVTLATYKDLKKLTDADRPHLLAIARASRSSFDSLYPPVAADKRFLLRALVPPEVRPRPEDVTPKSLDERARELMNDEGMSYAAAQVEASLRSRGLR